MNVRGKLTAAAGSMALNVLVLLLLGQAAGAATPASERTVQERTANEWIAQPAHVVVYQDSDRNTAREHCRSSARTRAIVAVILGMIV